MEEKYIPQKQRGWWILYALNALALVAAGLSILDQAMLSAKPEEAAYQQQAEAFIWEE